MKELFSKKEVIKTMTQLRSHCHQIVVNEIDKVAISSFDNKRFLPENGVSSLAYGHYKILKLLTKLQIKIQVCFFCSTKIISVCFPTPTGSENLYSVLVLDLSVTNDSLPLDSGSCRTASSFSLASTSLASSSSIESDSTTEPIGFAATST